MAANNSIHSLHHHHSSGHHHHRNPPQQPSTAFFLKPPAPPSTTTTLKPSLSATLCSFSPTTPSTIAAAAAATSTSEPATSLDTLRDHLAVKDYRQADEETRRLLIALAGEAAVKRGYVFFSEVQFIPESDLKAVDSLWKEHSGGEFGYSVQKKIWEKANKDFSRFFVKVGWMKKLDTEVEQYNYRSFPTEFMWELTEETPEGHLPLTNALRGTQLLSCVLSHPAFKEEQVAAADQESEDGEDSSRPRDSSKRLFKTNYSF